MQKKPEVSALTNLCQANSGAISSCMIYSSPSVCMAAYGNGCTQVALIDPVSGMSSVCAAYPLSPNGCAAPITLGQGPTTGGGGGPTGACTGQAVLSVVDSAKLNFGKSFVGTSDFSRTITLKNTGSGTCSAVLDQITLSNSTDFSLISSSGCASGTVLAPNATCNFSLVMKSLSAGAKTTGISVPFTQGGQAQAAANFTASSTILADSVSLNPAVSNTVALTWPFSPTTLLSGQTTSSRCSLGNSIQSIFFKSISVTSPSEVIYFSAFLSGVSPSATSIGYYGKLSSSCFPGGSDCSQTWTNFNFSNYSSTAPIEIGATAVPVYFKNQTGTIQSLSSASRATANLAYKPKSAPADAPNKVRAVPLITYCN
jgi:hypothetical protein